MTKEELQKKAEEYEMQTTSYICGGEICNVPYAYTGEQLIQAYIDGSKSQVRGVNMSVYLALVYTNDYLDDILVFKTLESAENFKKNKDSFTPTLEIKVCIEQHYVRE